MTHMSPKMTVIIPILNAEGTLAACLDSAIAQTLSNIEIICIDDGSNDATPDILARYGAIDPRIQIITQQNSGVSAARNRGLEIAKGEWIAFLDADDTIVPSAYQKLVRRGESVNAELVVFDLIYQYIGRKRESVSIHHPWTFNSKLLPAEVFEPLQALGILFQLTIPSVWNKIYRRELIEREHLRFSAELGRAEDLPFFYSALTASRRVTSLKKPFYRYRVVENGSLNMTHDKNPCEILRALDLLKMQLESFGNYQIWKRDFLNFAMNQILYTLSEFRSFESYKQLFNRVKSGSFGSFDFTDADSHYFYDEKVFEALQTIQMSTALEFLIIQTRETMENNYYIRNGLDSIGERHAKVMSRFESSRTYRIGRSKGNFQPVEAMPEEWFQL